jgi:hypothetical protein
MTLAGCQKPAAGPVAAGSAGAPSVHWSAAHVDIRDLPAQVGDRLVRSGSDTPLGKSVFRITVEAGDGSPILGEYAVMRHISGSSALRFQPRFPFQPGVGYRAVFDSSGQSDLPNIRVESRWTAPEAPHPDPAEVTHVYPSGDRLPENLLRFYLHFSAPMNRGEGYDHIQLLDSAGHAIDTPFLTLGEELWDESGRRLTLFIDPGRIKRGLKPREDLGPVLEAGKSYTLVITPGWRDAHGQPMAKEFRKSFRAEPPVERGIEISEWRLESPPANTTTSLVVHFPRPLDHALLHRGLSVVDDRGSPVPGTIAVEANETRWAFRPQIAWSAGRYELVAAEFLEDIAGNRPGRPFEVDPESKPIKSEGPAIRRAFDLR